MIQSTHNPRFASVSNEELNALYIDAYNKRKEAQEDSELDALDSELFWIDDELCARGLDLPC